MPTVSELTVVLNVDDRDLTSGLKSAEKQVGGFGDSLTKGLGMGLGFGAIGAAIDVAGSALGALKGSVVDLNGSLEQSQIAFTTMLGSAEKAETFLGDLQKFAAQTPFEFPDLVSASKRMLAFGFESKQVVPLLTAVGDAVAAVGGGAEVIDGVTTAIGQMQAKGKVTAEEMGQLAERGIPAWDMLAKKLGVSVAEAMDMVSKGQVKAATFVEAFQEGAAQRFGGMMEKQAQTWTGALSTITDSLSMATAKAFQPFFVMISQGAIALAGFLQSDTFTRWADAATRTIGVVANALRYLFEIFTTGDGPFIEAQEALNDFFPPAISDRIINIVNMLGGVFENVFGGDIPAALDFASLAIEEMAGLISDSVEAMASALVDWIGDAGPDMMAAFHDLQIDVLDWLVDASLAIIEKLGQWAAAFIDWIGPQIPDLIRELGAFLVKLTTWLVDDALPTILGKLALWAGAFVEWIGPKIEPMLLELGKLLLELGTWIVTTALPAIVLKLGEWASAFVDWVAPKIAPLLLELGALLLKLGEWMAGTALPALVVKLGQWATAFVDWVAVDVVPKIPGALAALLTSITTWVGQKISEVVTAAEKLGAAMIRGLQDGIQAAWGAFSDWLRRQVAERIPETIRQVLGLDHDTGALAMVGRRMVDELKIGIQNRWPSLQQLWQRLGDRLGDIAGAGDSGGRVRRYIIEAAAERGIDPRTALAIARHEGGEDDYMQIGKFKTGWSFWPFQLHYGGKGYEYFGTTAGMGNDFTRKTGWQPGDVNAWKDSIDWALDHARRYGWGAWYGRGPAGVGAWEGIPGHALGGWVGLHGPELGWLGERGPEYVVPNHALRGASSAAALETHRVELTIGGQAAADLYVTGREVAIRYGRATA